MQLTHPTKIHPRYRQTSSRLATYKAVQDEDEPVTLQTIEKEVAERGKIWRQIKARQAWKDWTNKQYTSWTWLLKLN